jgi:eukaryotic-like serine/threonine-protein kinase
MTVAAENPTHIGPYRVLHELGRGGMGVVYRAAREDGPELALKMPSKDLSQVFGALRREIHALGRLRHPGVVRILDEGVEQGVPWYAMELLHGQSLDHALDLDAAASEKTAEALDIRDGAYGRAVPQRANVRADLPRALTLMYRLARVLAYVHSRGIVHRDLKPGNVFVRSGDRPVLVDFGLVAHFQALTGREVLEVTGRPTGTALYVAPEQARGELVDARADLYSFGIMLYEIIAGRPPFDGNSVSDIFRKHIHDQPVRPSALVHDVPPLLEQLILRLLEKKRSARLGYAEDVAKLLVEAGAVPDAEPDSATTPYLYRPDIVGRRETIDATNALIRNTRKGEGAFLMLGGVSGIGKTSVAAILAREATLMHVRVITGESVSGGGAPLHPLQALLRDIADRCRGHRDVFERVLGPRLPVLRDLEPSLAALDHDAQPIAPEIASRRLFSDLAETLAAFAREQPLLLILDDLQWADEVTMRFLASLGPDFFAGLPLVILGTYRVDESGPELRALVASAHVTNVPLERLDDNSVAEIVRSMLAAPDAPPGFLQFLATQTEGNPFFVAEYLRSAVAEHLLFRESGRWHVAASDENYASLALPGTIRDLVAHRLARLSPLARRAAEAAAVLGRELSEEQFLGVWGESEGGALDAIAELTEQHVFESPSETGAENIRFAHDKLREGAYAGIEESRRRELHRRAVDVIERACNTEEELRRHEAELARHCDAAGLQEKAIHYFARAAETAVGTGACREAIDFMNRAITLDEALVPDPQSSILNPQSPQERRAHWQRVLSFAQFGLGDLSASSEHARTSLGELGIALPQTPRGWQRRLAAEALRQSAHFLLPRSMVRSHAAKPVLRDIAMAAQKFSEGRYYTDEKTVMLASGLLAVNSAERLDDDAGLIHTYANFGAVTSGLGLNRIASRYYGKARQLAQATDNFTGLGHIGYTSAVLYITTCDWKSCARYFDDAVAAAKKSGDHQLIEMNLIARGFFELYRGRIAMAAETFDTVRDRAHKRHNRQHEAWGHTWRAAGLILMNRGAEALEGLGAALDLIAPYGDNAKLSSYALRCQALLHLGKLDEAVAAADVTSAAVSKIPAIIWEKYRGLSAPAEVYLEAWERRQNDAGVVDQMRKSTDVLLRRLELVSRRMPLALPVALRLMGVRECIEGNTKRGEKLLRKSIAAAVRLELPIDEGISTYELARRCASGAEQRTLRSHAREILSKAGCELYLEKLETET